MSSRSKEKFAAAMRKLFRSTDKLGDGEGAGAAAGPSGSPARRGLKVRHRDGVAPVDSGISLTVTPAVAFNKKKCGGEPQGIRTKRLMKEFQEMQRIQSARTQPHFTVELVGDNLFEWYVRLYKIDPESELARDLRELRIPCILLHLVFPDNFPFAPPFMRVIEPQIEKGFVMEGGAICMELLTPRGWASAYNVEAVVMQFSASLVKGQGRVAHASSKTKEFTRRRAEESFRSLVKTHDKYGWVTPSLSDG